MIIDTDLKIDFIKLYSNNSSSFPLFWQDYQWIEFYAGKAACTYAMRRAGYRAARFDKLYFDPQCQKRRKSNFYDLNTPSGFAFLGSTSVFWILQSQTLVHQQMVSLSNLLSHIVPRSPFQDPLLWAAPGWQWYSSWRGGLVICSRGSGLNVQVGWPWMSAQVAVALVPVSEILWSLQYVKVTACWKGPGFPNVHWIYIY